MRFSCLVFCVLSFLVTQNTAEFELNTKQTTPGRKPWFDYYDSYELDWVWCSGDYALCFYSNCTFTNSSTGNWANNHMVSECPCEDFSGVSLVLFSAILDKQVYQETAAQCPHGIFSCPQINSAPICHAINNQTLYQGVEGVDRVSTWSYRNATKNHNVPLEFTDCPHGQFAGCMTAPCFRRDGKLVCECPIATDSFQLGGKKKSCDNQFGVWSGSIHPTKPHNETLSVVPTNDCTGPLQICYQGQASALKDVLANDIVGCPSQQQAELKPGRCEDHGYPTHVTQDPLFLVDVYMKHVQLTPGDLLERCERKAPTYKLSGTALVITTSHDKLGNQNCTNCTNTGVTSPEFTVPYLLFAQAGLNVTLASIQGGNIPIDPMAKYYTKWDVQFWNNESCVDAARNSPSVAALDLAAYDLVYMAGGWGAAWDLGTSAELGRGISKAFARNRVLGSVCHGALGFIQATKPDGSLLVNGTVMTAVTNRQIEELKIASLTPQHPQTELEKREARYECRHGVLTDLDQSLVVEDGLVVTGQNQNSACETAQKMMDLLLKQSH